MKCIIIDDEPIARKGMKRLVESRHELELDRMFDNAIEATDWLKDNNADLIFLDIEMPKLNGVEFARSIPDRCSVIFTTAYSEYAVDGFEVNALDYLLKPIDPVRFNRAVDRAISYKALIDDAVEDNNSVDLDFVIVKSERKYVRIRLQEILYVEGLKDYVVIHLPDKKVVTRMTVKAMEDTLPKQGFIRVNKSYIVNKEKIDSFDNNDVCIGSMEIAIGLSYREKVLNTLLK